MSADYNMGIIDGYFLYKMSVKKYNNAIWREFATCERGRADNIKEICPLNRNGEQFSGFDHQTAVLFSCKCNKPVVDFLQKYLQK